MRARIKASVKIRGIRSDRQKSISHTGDNRVMRVPRCRHRSHHCNSSLPGEDLSAIGTNSSHPSSVVYLSKCGEYLATCFAVHGQCACHILNHQHTAASDLAQET